MNPHPETAEDHGTLVFHEQSSFEDGSYIDAKIWQDVSSGQIEVKYRLVYSSAERLAICYDNEHGYHHRHYGSRAEPYPFRSVQQLISDFLLDVIQHRRPK